MMNIISTCKRHEPRLFRHAAKRCLLTVRGRLHDSKLGVPVLRVHNVSGFMNKDVTVFVIAIIVIMTAMLSGGKP